MRTDNQNRWEYGNGSKDAARLSTLMGNTGKPAESSTRSSIPMPPLDRGNGEQWNARGAMTLEGYQRLRKGYERGINPEALERMEEQQGASGRTPADDATDYVEPTRTNVVYGEPYELERKVYEPEYEENAGPHTTYANVMNAREEYQEPAYPEPVRRPRRMGPIAVTLILLIGIVGALLLYAGGMEYISDLFRAEQPVSDENLTLVTERPGAEPQIDPSGTLAPGEEMALNEENQLPDAEASEAEHDEMEATAVDAAAATAAAEKLREQERRESAELKEKAEKAKDVKGEEKKSAEKTVTKPTATDPLRTVQTTKPTTKPTTPVKATTTTTAPAKPSGAKAYTVQVRATPNKEEADRVARTLRAKGGSDVHIVAAEKNGETVYRVRFGSFSSEAEGKAKAGEMGFGDVWMIKQ